jgi:hypothetical protein
MSSDNSPLHTDGADPFPANLPTAVADPPPASVPVTVPEDLTPAESKAFDEMVPALKAKALEMRSLMLDEMVSLLDSRYTLGSLVMEIKKNPQTYGAMSDIQLAQFFGEGGRSVCSEARHIRERYDPEDYARIKNALNPRNGARISFKHLAILLRIEDAKLADKLLNACLQAGWSTKELSHHVGKKLVELSKQPGGAGRKSRAVTFLGLVENYTSVTEGWNEQYKEVWDEGRAFLEAFNKIAEEKIDDALVNRLKKALALSEEFEESQGYVGQELRKYIERAEEVIRRRRKGGKAAAKVSQVEESEGEEGEGE